MWEPEDRRPEMKMKVSVTISIKACSMPSLRRDGSIPTGLGFLCRAFIGVDAAGLRQLGWCSGSRCRYLSLNVRVNQSPRN